MPAVINAQPSICVQCNCYIPQMWYTTPRVSSKAARLAPAGSCNRVNEPAYQYPHPVAPLAKFSCLARHQSRYLHIKSEHIATVDELGRRNRRQQGLDDRSVRSLASICARLHQPVAQCASRLLITIVAVGQRHGNLETNSALEISPFWSASIVCNSHSS